MCRSAYPENLKSLDSLYLDSGISVLDEVVPKKYNRLIVPIDTKEKKDKIFKIFSDEQWKELKAQCTQELPKRLLRIKNNVRSMKEEIDQFNKQFENVPK